MTDIAKKAIGLKGWRWMPGMLSLPPQADRCQRDGQMMVGRLPDLTDPATLGCLLALVREAWAPARVVVYHQHGQPEWEINVELPDGSMPCVESADSEGAVLVAALEAAEGREVSDES